MNEEFEYRGYVQITLTSGMGFWPSALLLFAFFGANHLNNLGEISRMATDLLTGATHAFIATPVNGKGRGNTVRPPKTVLPEKIRALLLHVPLPHQVMQHRLQ